MRRPTYLEITGLTPRQFDTAYFVTPDSMPFMARIENVNEEARMVTIFRGDDVLHVGFDYIFSLYEPPGRPRHPYKDDRITGKRFPFFKPNK